MKTPDQQQKLREFGLTSLAVDNATSIFILTFMIFLFGLQAYNTMPKEQFPDASLPTVYINTPYFGNSAAEIENLIIDKRFGTFFYSSPPMFSSRYFSQFTSDLWQASLSSFHFNSMALWSRNCCTVSWTSLEISSAAVG